MSCIMENLKVFIPVIPKLIIFKCCVYATCNKQSNFTYWSIDRMQQALPIVIPALLIQMHCLFINP